MIKQQSVPSRGARSRSAGNAAVSATPDRAGWHNFERRRAGLRLALCSTVAALVLGGALASPSTALAAEAAESADTQITTVAPVIVTARRTEEDIQRVPLTVTALNPVMLKVQSITDVEDLTYAVPSLTVATAQFSNLESYFAIRGLNTGVATYFSDAPCCGNFASIPFMDIAQVQVLNGPQGTLFGRSSAAGAVLIDPQHPILDGYSGLIDVTGGDYGRAQVTGVVNIPIIEDHLAIRLAANFNHVNGYTTLIPSGANLDEINNQQYRVGIEFKAGRFDNYLVGQYINVNESGTSNILLAGNPNFSLFNLPAAFGPYVFGAVCAQAVSDGLSPNANACVNQRLATLSQIESTLQAQLARVAAGGSAVRSTLAPYNGLASLNEARHSDIVDIAQYDLGKIFSTNVSIKNILSFHTDAEEATGALDGIGGLIENGTFAIGPSIVYPTGSNTESGNLANGQLGPPIQNYTEEFQIHGNTRDGLLISTFGAFFSDIVVPKNLDGVPIVYQAFAGALSPNLGYETAGGFTNKEITTSEALYTQATLDLSRVGVHGLSLTAGYRYSWDYQESEEFPVVYNYPSGVFSPGTPGTDVVSRSKGYNYTFSIAEQLTDKLMFYGTISRAYVPGGNNLQYAGASSLPEFTPTFQPEIVLDKEFGVKYDFEFAGVRGRIDADAYWDDFTNIAEPFVGVVNGQSVDYVENIAGSALHGVELQATLFPVKSLEITGSYNYNDAYYTNWIGEDPYGVATPGSPGCLPTSPTGTCFLNLKDNPFEFMPKNQGHVTVRYTLPVDETLGTINVSLTGYAQSRVYFDIAPTRDLQILPSQGVNALSTYPYALLNLRVDWNNVRQSGWNAAFFINNVTNQIYETGVLTQIQILGYSEANYGPPRMFGIEVSKKF